MSTPRSRLTKGAPSRGAARARPIPPFTAEHERFRAHVRGFVESELRPHADQWEREQ